MQKKKINILFLIPSISPGGAERVMVHLFNHLSREKFDVHLAVLHMRDNTVGNFREGSPQFYDLNIKRTRNSPLALIKIIRSVKPDVVFSSLPALNITISIIKPFLPKAIKFIIRESSIPSKRSHKIPGFFYRYYYKNLLRKNALIICQGKTMADDLITNFSVPVNKTAIIHNPIDFNQIKNQNRNVRSFDVLLVAGLKLHKGINRLIEASRFMDSAISIGIIGSGPESKNLQSLSKKSLIQFSFLGHQSDPVSYMKKTRVVVQTSFYEGFSNVLLESLAVGTPVVAFDVPGGTKEIIQEGINGYLVPDNNIKYFAQSIQKALSKHWDHKTIRENAYQTYNLDDIISQYEIEIQKTMSVNK